MLFAGMTAPLAVPPVRPSSPTWSVYEDEPGNGGEDGLECIKGGATYLNPNIRTLKSYKKVGVIKRGAQGVVYVATDPQHQQEEGSSRTLSADNNNTSNNYKRVAIKRFFANFKQYQTRGLAETILREVGILKTLPPQENIVKVYNTVLGPGTELCLAIELCDLSLADLIIEQRQQLSAPLLKFVLRSILKGLVHLHNLNGSSRGEGEPRYLHRDMKLSNVLLTLNGGVKLGDFGSSREIFTSDGDQSGSTTTKRRPMTPSTQRITLCYRPPECLLGDVHYTQAVDLWGLGVMMAEMLEQRHLFKGVGEIGMLNTVWELIGAPSEADWPEMKTLPVSETFSFKQVPAGKLPDRFSSRTSAAGLDLLKGLLTANPNKRLTANQAFNHAFFSEDEGTASQEEFSQLIAQVMESQQAAKDARDSKRAGVSAQLGLALGDDDDEDCDFELGD